jgi:hypothetical protein
MLQTHLLTFKKLETFDFSGEKKLLIILSSETQFHVDVSMTASQIDLEIIFCSDMYYYKFYSIKFCSFALKFYIVGDWSILRLIINFAPRGKVVPQG